MPGTSGVPDSEIEKAVLTVIERADEPLTLPKIRAALVGPYRIRLDPLKTLVNSLATAGKIHPWPKAHTLRFWAKDPARAGEAALLDRLRGGPLSASELARPPKPTRPDYPAKKAQTALLGRLLREGRVLAQPPEKGKRTTRYGVPPAQIRPHLENAAGDIARTATALGACGISPEDILAALHALVGAAGAGGPPAVPASSPRPEPPHPTPAPSPAAAPPAEPVPPAPDLAARLSRVLELVRRPLLPIPHLRRLFPEPKAEFDAAVLRLHAARRVILHAHDRPLGIADDERAELVAAPGGVYYAAIGPAAGAAP